MGHFNSSSLYTFGSLKSLEELTDDQLIGSIQSKKNTLRNTVRLLTDGGAKLRANIKRHEDELNRRKIEQQVKMDYMRVETSRKETLDFCNNQKIIVNGDPKGGRRLTSFSGKLPVQYAIKLSKCDSLNNDKNSTAASTFSALDIGKNMSRYFAKVNDIGQAIQSNHSRSEKGQPVVLDDDDDGNNNNDEPGILEKIAQEKNLAKGSKEAKICYPSRDDLGCVEICYSDIDRLAPEGYLTSTIMNFYIQYLKKHASLTNRSLSEYQFFSTFFYQKLQEAFSVEKSHIASSFEKFRRWWKGVNIFQKAYVFVPIHQRLHWSLIIICMPDKEDESGPIILHLDSLNYHRSKSIFENIRRYLIEEKKYLDKEDKSSDVPFADRIWKQLHRSIKMQATEVPQQSNQYDCGLFVLYFIERFIDDAPKRLREKDLALLGKRWFQPEEASSLRAKIRKLLVAELENSVSDDSFSKSSPLSSAGTATPTERAETANDSLDT